jgi:hypothetical protein
MDHIAKKGLFFCFVLFMAFYFLNKVFMNLLRRFLWTSKENERIFSLDRYQKIQPIIFVPIFL